MVSRRILGLLVRLLDWERKEESGVQNATSGPLKLWPGQQVSGRLLYPDKTPAGGVQLTVGTYLANVEWKKRLGMDLTWYSFDHGDWPNWSRRIVTNEDGTFTATVPPENSRSWLRVGTTGLGFGAISLNGMDEDGAGAALAKCVPFEYQVGGHDESTPEIASLRLGTGCEPLGTWRPATQKRQSW